MSPAAIYQIVAAAGTATAGNYTITPVNGTLQVKGSVPQSVLFSPLPNLKAATAAKLTAISTSGLPVTYTATGGTINGSQLTVGAQGTTVTVTAAQSGNSSYAAATAVQRTFTAQ